MPSVQELLALLTSPNETLTVEHKSWLDLTRNPDKAKLAKAAIALANHGGGIIVLGMRPDNDDGGALASQPRPEGLQRYSQDDVNAAINRYADPEFHCELQFAAHPETNLDHAFVIVPGGIATPVMSTRGAEGVIRARGCYIRKAGPKSEEPFTAEEWRELLDRCVRDRREDMLEAIRLIVQGSAGRVPDDDASDALRSFTDEARQRWQELIEQLPPNDVARLPHGHYELSFDILNDKPAGDLGELRRRMEEAGRIKHTGWGPFVSLTREPLRPRPVSGMVEAWLGVPEDGRGRATSHCDFWRAQPQGRLYLQRGYDEDGSDRSDPGELFNLTTPIWRVGEALLYVGRLSRTFDPNASIVVRCRYTGLRNRTLSSRHDLWIFHDNLQSADDEADLEIMASSAEIEDNLAEIVHPLLKPLYERFSFFDLPMQVVARELEEMRKGRF